MPSAQATTKTAVERTRVSRSNPERGSSGADPLATKSGEVAAKVFSFLDEGKRAHGATLLLLYRLDGGKSLAAFAPYLDRAPHSGIRSARRAGRVCGFVRPAGVP